MDIVVEFFGGLWSTLAAMSPYLLFGFLVAGVLSVTVSPALVERHLGGRGLGPVVKASLFGIPLPLCSCGVIPVAASLRRHGASRGATASFLISTPQTGVDSVMITLGLLGPIYAVFRPLAAFVSGVLGGVLVDLFGAAEAGGREGGAGAADGSCGAVDSAGPRLLRALRYALVTLPRDIGQSLLFGLIVAAAISAVVPADFFALTLGTGITAMLAMLLLGIPVYVCATASVPIAAAMIAKGVSPGAALVFLMTGPATNAAAIATIWKTLGRRTAGLYLVVVAGTALLAGLGLDQVYTAVGRGTLGAMHEGLPAWVETGAAFLLLAVLFNATAGPFRGKSAARAAATGGGRVRQLRVMGMTCSHCAEAVRRALAGCRGVETVEIDLESGIATVTAVLPVTLERLCAAVAEAGYRAVGCDGA